MAFDQAGEGGLRRRLRMAVEPPSSVAEVAEVLGIPPDVLDAYLSDPTYLLSSDQYASAIEHLAELPENIHTRDASDRWLILFDEKPQWTQEDIDAIEVPRNAHVAVVFVFDGSYSQNVRSVGPVDLDVFSIQQTIEAATEGNPDLLITVVWYVDYEEYPLPDGC